MLSKESQRLLEIYREAKKHKLGSDTKTARLQSQQLPLPLDPYHNNSISQSSIKTAEDYKKHCLFDANCASVTLKSTLGNYSIDMRV